MTNEPPPYPGDPNPSSGDLPAYGSAPPPEGGLLPAPSGHGGEPYSASDAIAYGWRKFKDNAGVMIAATLIVFVGSVVIGLLSEAIASSPDYFIPGESYDLDAGKMAASLVVQSITGGLRYILVAMLIRGALDVVDGAQFDIGRAFGALNLRKVLAAGLVLSVLDSIGFTLFVVPGFIFWVFAYFALYFVVDKGADDPFSAIGKSFSLVGRNLGKSLVSGLLSMLVFVAGTLLCLVGLLGAFPIVTLASAYAFRRFQGQPVAP